MWVPELEVGDFKFRLVFKKPLMIVILSWVPNLQIPCLKGQKVGVNKTSYDNLKIVILIWVP